MVILVGSGDKEYTEFLKKEIANRKLKNNFYSNKTISKC